MGLLMDTVDSALACTGKLKWFIFLPWVKEGPLHSCGIDQPGNRQESFVWADSLVIAAGTHEYLFGTVRGALHFHEYP
jgi:hypothetical protein